MMMNEKMDLLQYMAENGYDFEDLTMEDFAKYCTLEGIRALCAEFLGEDPTA